MKKMVVLILLLHILPYVQAQNASQKLIDNPDITWVAESKAFISFENSKQQGSYGDEFLLENQEGNRADVQVLKYSEEALCERDYSNYFLSAKINNGLENGTLKAFDEKGKDITDHVVDEVIVTIDTFASFHPNTIIEQVEIVEGKALYDWYEVTLVYYYDSKSNSIESLLKSISPLINVKTKKKKRRQIVVTDYESFTIPMEQEGISQLEINKPEVIWSKLSNLEIIDFSKVKVLKGNTSETMKTVFHDNIIAGKYKGFQTKEACNKDIVDADWVKAYTDDVEIDTFISLNPITYKKTVGIVDNSNKYGDIDLLGLRHYWYWDSKKNQLVCDLKSIRFYNESYDDKGQLLFSFIVYEVDFK